MGERVSCDPGRAEVYKEKPWHPGKSSVARNQSSFGRSPLHCAFLKQQRKVLGIKSSQLPNMAFLQMAEEITLSEYVRKEKVRWIQVYYVHYEIIKEQI